MGVEDKYPGYTYHNYKENHPVHQFNSGKTNSHVRINGTVYIDDGSGPVPLIEDYDKLNNKTFQDLMKPGLPAPLYLKDLDYDGEFPTTSNEYKVASKLLNLVTAKGTMPCTWSLAGAEDERIVFVEPTKEGSNLIKFNLGGYVYSMEVLSDKVITKTKPIDEGSDDYDKLNDDIFQEFVSIIGIPTPFGLKSLDFTNKHPDSSYEYKFASAIKTKLENGEDLKCTWSVSGDKDESVIFVTPTLTDGCIKFTLGGNLYSMEFTDDNKIDCTTTPINEFQDYDVFCDETFQEFAKTCGFTTDIQLKDLNYDTTVVRGSKEYNLFIEVLTNGTIKYTWSIDDEEYIFVEPTKYDDNIVAFTLGGTLYKMEVSDDTLSMKFTTEPLNKLRHESDYWMDYYTEITTTAPELKQLLQADGTYYDEGTDEYEVLNALYEESLANGNLKALYTYTTLTDGSVERIMCDVTASVNRVLYINTGVEIIRAQFMDNAGNYFLVNRYNSGETDSLYNNWCQKWYMEIDSDNLDDHFFILDMNSNKPKHYLVGSREYECVSKLFQAISSNEKKPVKIPIARSTDVAGQDSIIFAELTYYSGVYGPSVVTEADFTFGRYNYRLIYNLDPAPDGYVCLDKHIKTTSLEEDMCTFIDKALGGSSSRYLATISYGNVGESPVPLDEDNNELAIVKNLHRYWLGDSGTNPGNEFKYMYRRRSYSADDAGIDYKYQINDVYETVDVRVLDIKVDDDHDHNKTRYSWIWGNAAYFVEYDPVTDTWTKFTHYLMNGGSEPVLYDSNAHTNAFRTIIGRNDIYMNDICRLPDSYGTEINMLIAALKSMSTSGYKRVLTVPYSLSNTTLQAQRYDLCELTLIEGYTNTSGDHPGLVISNPKGEIQIIDYFEYNSVPKYYITRYDDLSIRTHMWYHTGDSMGSSTISRLYNYEVYNSTELENIVFPFLGYDCLAKQNSVGQSKILRTDSAASANKSAFDRMKQIVYGLGKQFVLGADCVYAWTMDHNSTGKIIPCRVNTYGTGWNSSTLSARCEHTAFIVTAPEGQYVIKMYDSSWNTVSCIDSNIAIITITNITGLNITDVDELMAYIRNCYITGAAPTPYAYEGSYMAYNAELAPLAYMQYGASSSSKQVYPETDEVVKRINALRKCAEFHAQIFGHTAGQNDGMLFKAVWDFGMGNHSTANMTKIQLTDVKCLDVGTYNNFQMCIGGDKYHISKNGTNWELWID